MRKTKQQLVEETEKWLEANKDGYRAIKSAAELIQSRGKQVPTKFLVEILRFSTYLGADTMYEVVDRLGWVSVKGGEHSIPNEITAGIARKLANDGVNVTIRKSKFDEPDKEWVQDALF